MADWWCSTADSHDPEAYARRKKELEEARLAEILRLEEEEALIQATTDPDEKLRLRRERYMCEEYLTVADLEPWEETLKDLEAEGLPEADETVSKKDTGKRFPFKPEINRKIVLHQGDITELEVDAIVNAANSSLLGGGGIDGAIHSAAGPLLLKECRALKGCETGQTKITKGYSLPAKHVLHTVGPFGKGDSKLQSCYRTCLETAKDHGIRSIAFCCVGTGIYSFPLVRAAHIALRCVREWMESNPDVLDTVIFCVFQPVELEVYLSLMPSYFPSATFPSESVNAEDMDAVPINQETIAAEAEAEKRDSDRHRAYYSRWLASCPDDEDDVLKAGSVVPKTESSASLGDA